MPMDVVPVPVEDAGAGTAHGRTVAGSYSCLRAQSIAPQSPPGLYALTVVPRAPNFSALRRVSSNLERMYVLIRFPASMRSNP